MAAGLVTPLSKIGGVCNYGSSIRGSRVELGQFAELVSGVRSTGSGGSWQPGLAWAASKQKKGKAKEKRKSSGGGRARTSQWNFDALMLVWDDAFDKNCEDRERASTIRSVANGGLERFGSGCVLVRETVRTLPRGSASGFSSHSRPTSKNLDAPPAYETLTWIAEYVPRTFVRDPSLAPETIGSADDSNETSVVDVTNQVIEDVPLVTRQTIIPVLRGMDRTRILGLTGDDVSSIPVEGEMAEPIAPDAGGEEPYNPRNEELVLMLIVEVDGQRAVGADVVKALPITEENGQVEWKLEMRDFHTLPIPE